MTLKSFETAIADLGDSIAGPWRNPHQMLASQEYDSHASIHDDSTARKLGFRGGTIEGPTHFSQFVPLCERLWGNAWFETGCISARYCNPCFEGDEVQAIVVRPASATDQADIRMVKRDGVEVLVGTVSVGRDGPATVLDKRLRGLKSLADPVILRDVKVGVKTKPQMVRMDFDQNMGALYPFSLNQKLAVITEPSPLYRHEGVSGNPWESLHGPLFVGETYQLEREVTQHFDWYDWPLSSFNIVRGRTGCQYEDPRSDCMPIRKFVVALSGSRRTESLWVRTTVSGQNSDSPIATMLLNIASIKESYSTYLDEYAKLYAAN